MNMQEAALLKAHLDRAPTLEAEVAALKERLARMESRFANLAGMIDPGPIGIVETVRRKPGRPKKNAEAHA